jgi:restriction system protein
MLGKKSAYAAEARNGNFIRDYRIDFDLSHQLPDNFKDFNEKYIPVWLKRKPGKSKISAGLSCGQLWAGERNAGGKCHALS